ncbi:MAG: ATPase, T2SS/T4P/T4SS family, partial [Methylococcaceae bacterium]
MATASTDFQFSGITKCLIQDGLLTENDAKIYSKQAQKNKTPIISYLVANKIIDSKTIASKASIEFGLPYFDLDAIDVRNLPMDLVSEKLIRNYHTLPLFIRGKTLFLAISDPTNIQALDDIKFQSRLHPETILVDENKLVKAIETALEAKDSSMSALLDEDLENLDITGGDEDTTKNEINSDIDDAPIVRFVNKILLDAIKKGASDIHMEPYEKNFRIRFRADGMLYQVVTP